MAKLKVTTAWLRKLNIVLAAVYAIQAVALAIVANMDSGIQSINASFFAVNTLASEANGEQILLPASQHLLDYNLVYGLVALLLILAIAHALLATKWRKTYEAGLKKSINRVRWLALAVGGALVVETVALVIGVTDIASLKAIGGLVVIGALVWLVSESFNSASKKPHWPTYWIGVASWLLAWLIGGIYVWAAVVYGENLPVYALWLVGSAFVLSALVGAVYFMSLKKYRWFKQYLNTEAAFSVTFFILSSAVVWQIFAGILTP